MKPRTRLLLALLLLLAVISWWLALDRPRRADEPAGHVAQAPTPEHERAPQQIAPKATPAAVTTPQSSPSTASPKPSAATTNTPPSAAPRAPDTRGWVNALQVRYQNDARDPAASSAEAALRAELGSLQLPSSLVRSVACRATMCKLELRWVAEQNTDYLALTAHLMGDNAKFFATRAQDPDKNGVALVDAYWFRR